MNKQEFIEKLKKNMPEGLNEVETAKYIYIQLGKEKAFDEKYFFGNSKTKKKIYHMAEETKNNTDIVAKDKKIICVSLSYLYRDILKEFGITSIIAEEGNHKYIIIWLKNGKKIKADLQFDLYNIQTKCKTKYFGTKSEYENYPIDSIGDDQFEIDKKIGYVENEEDYKDNAINSLKEKVKDKSAGEALDIIFTDKELNKFENKLEFIEMNKFYRSVLNKTIPQYLDKKIFSFNCYKENDNGEKDYTKCVYSEENNKTSVYMFSKKENKFIKVELEKIEELENEGLVLGAIYKERGVKRLKKIIKRENTNEKMFEQY